MTVEIVIVASAASTPLRQLAEIVVPVDPDAEHHRALPVARRLAIASGAHVNVVAVADPLARVPDDWRPRLHALAAEVQTARVGAAIVRAHSVAEGITAAAADLSHAAICMATDAPGRLRDAFELSSSSAVVHHIDVPVVLVGPHARTLPEEPIEEVIAFVDTSDMADRVVATAVDWAEALEARLWIVEVVEPDAGTSNDDVRDSNLVSGLARTHHRDGVDIEWDVLRSKDVPGEIARYLRDEHPKALPMLGSHGRSGWAELRLGSVSMRTAHEAPTPVVVIPVRPR